MRNKKVLYLTRAAVIAALYVVLTLLLAPISFREIQVRVSEMLTVLPFFTPAAVPGLFVGCLVANILGGAIPVDVLFGSLATLLGACGTYLIGKAARTRTERNRFEKGISEKDRSRRDRAEEKGPGSVREPLGKVPAEKGRSAAGVRFAATLPPVISNIIIVPLVLYYGYGVNLPIPLQMLTVGIGEVISCCLLGSILMAVLEKYRSQIFRTADERG